MTEARLLSRRDAAAYLSVSLQAVERLLHTGQLHAVRLPVTRGKGGRGELGQGRRILIDRLELDALVPRSLTDAAEPPPMRIAARAR